MATKRNNDLPLQGRTAIITGASGGIGGAVAHHLAALGANLVLADLRPINTNITSTGAIVVQTDVTNAHSVKALFDRAQNAFGQHNPVHILVTCAGTADPKAPALADATEEQWDMTFNVNARGTFLCCREAANRLARGGGGRIVTVSTSLVAAVRPRFGVYIASKAAVEAMTMVMAKEMEGRRITANCVAPGPIATELLFTSFVNEEGARAAAENCPMGRIGEPEDVARVVGFLVTDEAEWVNGQVIRVNGGESEVPHMYSIRGKEI